MRIGLDYRVVTAAPNSGIGRQVRAMEHMLRGLQHDQLNLYTAAPIDHPHRLNTRCPARPGPIEGLHRPQERWRFERKFLPQAIRDDDLDVYIATANSGLPIGRMPAQLRQVLLLHDVFQLTLRNHHSSQLKALAYRLTDRLAIGHAMAAAAVVWSPSQFTADEAARLFPQHAAKLRVLPNAVVPLSSPCAATADGLPSRYWLLVGSREPRKNLPFFLQAWQQARQHSGNVPAIVLVGARNDLPPALQQLPDLHVLSNIDDARLAFLYTNAERLWQPAYAEGFGLPVIEALSVGTPVVVARGSSLDEITPTDAPRFDPHNHEQLVDLMLKLAVHTAESSPQSRRDFASRYATDAYATRLHQLLDELRP